MTLVRSIAVALGLIGGVAGTALVGTATLQAAEGPQLSAKVAKPLKEAQEAMGKKQWDAALAEIKKAQAVEGKTPEESYQIDEFLGYVLIQQKKYSQAAPVFERMLNSGLVPADQVDDREKTVAQLYFQVKEYRKAAEWAQKWLKKHPGNEDMSVLLGQAYYLLNDYKNASEVMNDLIARAERNGRTPPENWIQIVLSSHFKTENDQGVAKALGKLVRHHPKQEYWQNLLEIEQRKDLPDPVTLSLYRLMLDVGVLKRSGDYVEMAHLANDAGLPGEAQKIVEKGIETGALDMSKKLDKERHERLLASFKERAEKDRAELPQLAKEAEKAATNGQMDVALGQAYLSYGRYADAVTALERGLKKGNVRDADEAQIALGIAYLKNGQPDRARTAFQAVKSEKWASIAELWSLRSHASA